MKSVSLGVSGSKTNPDSPIRARGKSRAENFRRMRERLLARDSGLQTSLLRRAKDHQVTAKVGARIAQFDEIVGRGAANGRICRCQVKSFSLRQQPMQSNDRQSVLCGLAVA